MLQPIPIIAILLMLAFWMWMFSEMTKNDSLPGGEGGSLRWPPTSKSEWTTAFIFFNIFAAILYYFNEYRKKSRRQLDRLAA
jgi:hypothetical protein